VCARLQELHSPLWPEARLAIGTAWRRGGAYGRAKPVLEELATFAERRQYAHVAARARHGLGLILEIQSDLAASADQFQKAISLSAASGEIENVAFVHTLLAENLRLLGRAPEAWQHFAQSLAMLDTVD